MKRGEKMSKYIIHVGSITHAMKGKEVLAENSYNSTVKRNKRYGKNEGCGYVLYVTGDLEEILQLLKDNYVKVLGYKFVPDKQ